MKPLLAVALVSPLLAGPIHEAHNTAMARRRPAWHWILDPVTRDYYRVWGPKLPDGTIENPQYEKKVPPFA